MSISPSSSLITDWIERGLKWKYVWQPTYRPFTVPANKQVQLPRGNYTFKHPEGIVITFSAAFDNPYCGIRFSNPQIDTLDTFTVNAAVFGGTADKSIFMVGIAPPLTTAGIYGIGLFKEWPWTDWCELHVFNSDSIDHTCYGFGYTLAVLMQERPVDATETALMAMLANSLYPIEETLKKKIDQHTVESWLERKKLRVIYEPRISEEER